MEESIHVVFDENNPLSSRKNICDDDDDLVESFDSLSLDNKEKEKEASSSGTKNVDREELIETTISNKLPKEWRTTKDHPLDNVIGDVSKR
ncbi:hypothetical protein PIB30_100608, partial [Stylosanthes scabra]|nr:hypothetical protein [Stylosanthes scabra]